MNILIIPDKFKFTFSSKQIGDMIKESIYKYSSADILQMNVSDGGEGFLDSIEEITEAKRIFHKARNPLYKTIDTYFLYKNKTAFIEYAKTGGLNLLPKNEQNPLLTSSFGLGQQISEALNLNAKKIIIGLGGSATNDGGIGMASALDFKFLNKKRTILKPKGANLVNIHDIKLPSNLSEIKKTNFIAATDVENYLLGKQGATHVFAGQKGATIDDIEILEKGLKNLSTIYSTFYKTTKKQKKGDGAAGGLGFGIRTFLDGKIISGADFIFDILKIEKKIKWADIIISGEGKLDFQSFNGKIIGKIYNLTQKHNKNLIIIPGISTIDTNFKNMEIYPLFNSHIDISEYIKYTKNKIENIIKNIFK